MTKRAFLFFMMLFMLPLNVMGFETTKRVIAHRGVSGHYPENTMVSFQRAIETKAQYIELDVHLSQEGVPMVMHDENLSRTTNGTGVIGQYTVTGLKSFSAGFLTKFGDKFQAQQVPTLEEVLGLIMKGSDKFLFIEIKSHDNDQAYNDQVGFIVYQTVINRFHEFKDRIAFISFNTSILDTIRELDPTAKLGPIFNELPKGTLADQALRLGSDIVIFSKKLLTHNQVLKKTDQVKHFIYTVLPEEVSYYNQYPGLYGFATDFADQIE